MSIKETLESQINDDANFSLMDWLAVGNIPASNVNHPTFRAFVDVLRRVSTSYALPRGKECGFRGTILQARLEQVKANQLLDLRGMEHIGSTLCSDGAKNLKRNYLKNHSVVGHKRIFLRSINRRNQKGKE